MNILAIDPGPEKSACIAIINGKIKGQIMPNADILNSSPFYGNCYDVIAIEMVACYGMAVGKEVFETCLWIGRFVERCDTMDFARKLSQLVYRRDVKLHFCNSARAKDTNIRQAILDRFGGKDKAIGNKALQGPLYAIKSHLWSALAIALYVQDTLPVSSNGEAPAFSVSKQNKDNSL